MGRGAFPPISLAVSLAVLALVATACGATGGDFAIGRLKSSTATTRPIPLARVLGPGAVVSPRGIVMPVVSRLPTEEWEVRTPCGATTRMATATPVNAAQIVLDPGHGGSDPGAVPPGNPNLTEAEVNLEVSRYAQAALERAGVSVLLTRTGDYDVELAPRAEIARALQPHAFVSVHHNAEPDGPRAGPGSETYYQMASADSKRLAGLIYEEIVRALSQYQVAWVADLDAGAKYRPGTRGDYYAMLRMPGSVVSVLAEFAFISNPPEAELLARPDVQRVEGEALARGILRYLTTSDPGSGFVEPYPRIDPPRNPNAPPPVSTCREPQL